jgi:hypothetical protein
MPNALDNAIARIQDIALATASVAIKSAPDYPVEVANALPGVLTYVTGGQFTLTNKTIHHNFVTVVSEFHFNRTNLAKAYEYIDAVILEFPKRLAGDPTLGGTITTIHASADTPATYEVAQSQWGQIVTQVVAFTLRLKSLQAPVTTA